MNFSRHRRLFVVAMAVILAGCGGQSPEATATRSPVTATSASGPSQILITIDAFAGRRVVPFGGTIAMPRLAEFAAGGTIYDDTVSTTTLSRPALVTILTGVSPDRSDVRDNIHDALPGGVATLAEGAQKRGYETAAFVSTPFASYSSGLQRGFELFDGPEPIAIGPAQHVPPIFKATFVAGHVKEWLASRTTDTPYFVWIHLSDLNGMSIPIPHAKPKPGEQPPDDLQWYDAGLANVDAAIGTITDAVRADLHSKNVEWTVTGTHGTYLGESGRYGDPFWLANETLLVPLVRVAPASAQPKAARHDRRSTWLPDVAATLAASMGVALDKRSDGVALGVQPPPDRSRLAWGLALDDQLGWPPETAVREGNSFAVFAAAPDGTPRATGTASTSALAAAVARPAVARPRLLPATARAAVLHAGVKLGTSSAPSMPKDRDTWLCDLQLVRRFAGGDRPLLAARRSKLLIEGAPDALASLVTRIYFFTGGPNKVAPSLQGRLLAHFPARSEALHWSAHVSLIDQRYELADALLDAAIAVGPVEPEMYYDSACVRSLRGDPKAALAQLDRALSAGYKNWDWIDKDPDLVATRADAGFPELLRAHGR